MNESTDPAAQLQWLVDRALIGDLVIEFARALDERDWPAYAATYDDDGSLGLPPRVAWQGREGMAEFAASTLSRFAGGTHHLSANHAIDIDGDRAHARAYVIAAHVYEQPDQHSDAAGWYDYELRRTSAGWRIVSVTLDIRYVTGEPIVH